MNTEKFVRDFLIERLKCITLSAEEKTKCKRKGVGCQLISFIDGGILSLPSVYNGPSRDDFECTNVVGNCGCMHSEPKAIMYALKEIKEPKKFIMICTYSPCTNCANIILNSGIVIGIVYEILTEHDKRGDEFLRKCIDVLTLEDLQFGDKEKVNAVIRKWVFTCSNSK